MECSQVSGSKTTREPTTCKTDIRVCKQLQKENVKKKKKNNNN